MKVLFKNHQRAGKPKTFAVADLSDDDRRQLLSRALSGAVDNDYCWIRDVYADAFTYEDWEEEGTYRRSYSIADDMTVTLGDPEEVISRTVYEPVKMSAFALSPRHITHDRFNVYPQSLLFEIHGRSEEFPDKGITITENDLRDIAASFKGATMGLEHMDTVLGDNCGYVTDVRLDAGRRLYGTVAVPKGLDDLIPPGPRKVSVEIEQDAAGKWSMPKVDLVLEPRIRRAALMSVKQFAGQRHSSVDLADIQAIHDISIRQGATCGSANLSTQSPRNSGKEKKSMGLLSDLAALFTKHGVEVEDELNDEENPPRGGTGVTDSRSSFSTADRAEFARLQKFEQDEKAAKLTTRRADVDKMAVRAFGATSDKYKAAKTRIDAADMTALDIMADTYGDVTPAAFSANGQAGGRQTASLNIESRPDAEKPEGDKLTEAQMSKKREETLKMTETGRQVLARERGTAQTTR